MATEVAREVSRFPEALPVKKMSDVLDGFLDQIGSPEVRKLASEKKTEEALQKAEQPKEKILVLLRSSDRADWEKAEKMLEDSANQEPSFFLTLAFRFWEIGEFAQAIAVAEKGFQLAPQKDPSLVTKFQNSLAYYYAETASPKYEGLAREYVAAARLSEPTNPGFLETEGFVKITYGKTKEEILEGVALSEETRRRGGPFELYAKNISRAATRLSQT